MTGLTMIAFTIPGEAVAFARSGGNGKVRFTPTKQRNHMGTIKLFAQRAMAGSRPLEGPVAVKIRAIYLPPKSWSRAKQGRANWKTSKPDADNLAKLVKDSLNSIVWRDDAQVCELYVQKIYGLKAETVITVMELGQDP